MKIWEEKSIKIPGFTIGLKIWNAKSPKPVLCLHGKMDNAASFDFLAPLFPDRQLVAVDYPGTGFSSSYPEGVMPHWKNDAYLMLHLIKELGWNSFDIIAHSLGSLLATTIAIARPQQVGRMIFLDILGPTVNFIEQRMNYFQHDIETYLFYNSKQRTLFPDQNSAIQDRMKIGNISYQAAQALVERGTIKTKYGWHWNFDQRLRCLSSTLPCEDELREMLSAIEVPVGLIRAKQGVFYPDELFQSRAQTIKDLSIYEVDGSHHVHMDDPIPVAQISFEFMGSLLMLLSSNAQYIRAR
ncbi:MULTISPECIES: alpha/beta fold hydrolase [Legionella]|uniref:Lipase A n=1 Tax=Legionella drozanskii LLAP-1 TaxID=1212489 RepID=A0A0W0SRV7_9GAMM|nr:MULTISPECIES: alpha/beta hydrolase [Legionella]KTC86096.1 lipase A [Legionella drozanskii LLAP-1]PJE08918.1 MAG: alpha/beta hydrolase [Legionella sp.]